MAQNEIFDHSEPAKDEIGQNQEILSRVENLAKNGHFWLLGTCKGYEIWQNPEILSRVVNMAQNLDFWSLRTCKWRNWAKSGNFESRWKVG